MYHNVDKKLCERANQKFDYEAINLLLEDILKVVFNHYDLLKINDYDKTWMIYQYLMREMCYDKYYGRKLTSVVAQSWERSVYLMRKELKMLLVEHVGICSALAQAYKLLLDKLKIDNHILIIKEGNIYHHSNIVKRDNKWFFDDVTSGLLKPKEESFNCDYERFINSKQVILGVFPNDILNNIIQKSNFLDDNSLVKNEYGLDALPENLTKGYLRK